MVRVLALSVIEVQHTRLWSRGEVALIGSCYSESFEGHFPGRVVRGRDGLRERVRAHRQTFPDWEENVIRLIIHDDVVVTQFRSTGRIGVGSSAVLQPGGRWISRRCAPS